jgi:ariadne-1
VLEEGDAAIFKEASVMREPIVKVHSPQVTCTVCDEVVPRDQASSASCGHMFCNNCWKQYLTVQINELQLGGGLIRCMQNKCTILVDEDLVHKIVDAELFKRYMNFLLESYVTKRPYHTWCPTPGCGSAIAITRGETMVGVQCGKCERSFCFSCQREPHLPATCAMVSAWHQKAKDDSETANWLVSHTKECPQCHKAVEKNGGCNHISCTCGAHFCWMCLGLFDTRTVYSHACNAFDDSNAFANANAQTARATLERYLHYYNRFYNHEQSKKLEANILVNIREKMNKLFERDKGIHEFFMCQLKRTRQMDRP